METEGNNVVNEELNASNTQRHSRDSRNSLNKKSSKISNIIESNTTTNTEVNHRGSINFNIPPVLMEKLEKEGIVSYESSPVNTQKYSEEQLHKEKGNIENDHFNLNVEMEKENIANTANNENKDKSIDYNDKINDEVRESIFLETSRKKGNRKSLFRGDLFDLEVEEEKKLKVSQTIKNSNMSNQKDLIENMLTNKNKGKDGSSVDLSTRMFIDDCYREEELKENINSFQDQYGNIKEIDFMSFIKKIIENPSNFYETVEFNKAFIDQHTGFVETKNLLNILISAFKHYHKKKETKFSDKVLEMIEYLICAKFDDFFLFETEQFTSYALILNNNKKEELLDIANKFFSYLSDPKNKINTINYFEKEELSLYLNLFSSADEGIKENKKLLNFFNRNKDIETIKNGNEKKETPNNTNNQNQSSDITKINSKDGSKIFFKSKSMSDNSIMEKNNSEDVDNKYNNNDDDIDKNELGLIEKSTNEEKTIEEELKQIKNRVKFHTVHNKYSNLNKEGEEVNTAYVNESYNLELVKKNNDYLINKCHEIINKIKTLNTKISLNTQNILKKKSLLNQLIQKQKEFSANSKTKLSLFPTQVIKLPDTDNLNDPESVFSNINQDPILPSVKMHKDYFDIFDWDDTEICKQLTLITHFIFERIKPKELINSQWTKVDKKTSAPNVYRLIERFNKISLWACEEILSYDKSSLRKLVLDKFINIAFILYKMNNYNDAFSIVTALNSFFIKELKKSWKRVDVNSSIPKAKELNEIFSHAKNYSKLRDMLDNCLGKPCVPFLGLFLKDLSYMDESQKYLVTKEQENIHLLNLEKIKNVDVILKKFDQYQRIKYDFKPVFKLSFLANPDPLSENILIEFARKLEPNFTLGNKKSKIKRKANTDYKIHELNPLFLRMIKNNEFDDLEKRIPLNELLNDLLAG